MKRFARDLDLEVTFWQTNHEGEYCESLHRAARARGRPDPEPRAWTHYSYAIRDALEVAGLPAVEVHISNIDEREEWRRTSVIRDLCVGPVQGKGLEGYREALELLRRRLAEVSRAGPPGRAHARARARLAAGHEPRERALADAASPAPTAPAS